MFPFTLPGLDRDYICMLHICCQSSENIMGVYINFGCFGTGFK